MSLLTLLCAVSLLATSQRLVGAVGPLTHIVSNCSINYVFLVHDVHSFVRRSPWLQYFRHSGRETHAFINGQRMQHEHSAVAAHTVPKLSANHSSSVSLLNVLVTVMSAAAPSSTASASVTATHGAVYVVLPEDSLPVKPLHEARELFCQASFSSLLCLRDTPPDSTPSSSASAAASPSRVSSCSLLALRTEEVLAVTRAWRDTSPATAAAATALLARFRNTSEECGGAVYDDASQGQNLTLSAISGTVWQQLLSHGGGGGGAGGGAASGGKRSTHRDHPLSLAQQLPQLQVVQVLPQSAGLSPAPAHSLSGFLAALSRSLVDDGPTATATTSTTSSMTTSNSSFKSSSGGSSSGSSSGSGLVIAPPARTLALLCLSEQYLFARGLVEPAVYSVSEDASSPLISPSVPSSPSSPVGFQETLHLLGVFSRVAPVTKSLAPATATTATTTAATTASAASKSTKDGGEATGSSSNGNSKGNSNSKSQSQSQNTSHSNSASASASDVHRQFVSTGSGDNGGLRVLLVSADDRVMKDSLEEADYVGTMAVLTQRYAARHGYDYLQLAATSTVGLVDRVKRKYGEQLSVKGVGDNKRGPSAFHPGYKQYRASSWAKVPSVWHAMTRFGDRYDYIWFLDSDATINPRLAHRSLSDALRVGTGRCSTNLRVLLC